LSIDAEAGVDATAGVLAKGDVAQREERFTPEAVSKIVIPAVPEIRLGSAAE